ncbi:MAG: KH domain-containing protein [Coriobacteriales bacterium]
MSQNPTDVTDLVRSLVEQIVDEPEAVAVDFVYQGSDEIEVQITVAEGDIGKVIGRQGRIIKAIRTLARAAASQCGLHAEVELAD